MKDPQTYKGVSVCLLTQRQGLSYFCLSIQLQLSGASMRAGPVAEVPPTHNLYWLQTMGCGGSDALKASQLRLNKHLCVGKAF